MQLDKYREDGFIVCENFLTRDEILKIRANIMKVFEPFTGPDVDDQKLINLFNSDFESYVASTKLCHQLPSIHALGTSDRMIEFVRSRFDIEPVINTRPVLLFSSHKVAKHHFYWKSKPHQDLAIMSGSPDSVVVWIPLCDMNEELGFLEVIPKSHKYGVLEHKKNGPSLEINQDLPDEMFAAAKMKIGDALFFSSSTIHRSGTNVSENIRLTVSYRYDNMLNEEFINKKYPAAFDYVMRSQGA